MVLLTEISLILRSPKRISFLAEVLQVKEILFIYYTVAEDDSLLVATLIDSGTGPAFGEPVATGILIRLKVHFDALPP